MVNFNHQCTIPALFWLLSSVQVLPSNWTGNSYLSIWIPLSRNNPAFGKIRCPSVHCSFVQWRAASSAIQSHCHENPKSISIQDRTGLPYLFLLHDPYPDRYVFYDARSEPKSASILARRFIHHPYDRSHCPPLDGCPHHSSSIS